MWATLLAGMLLLANYSADDRLFLTTEIANATEETYTTMSEDSIEYYRGKRFSVLSKARLLRRAEMYEGFQFLSEPCWIFRLLMALNKNFSQTIEVTL